MENLYWEIENYSGTSFSLFSEGQKIELEKLTIKDVEKAIDKKLIVCPQNQNPHLIVIAKVEKNGQTFYDNRKSRGSMRKCYLIKN